MFWVIIGYAEAKNKRKCAFLDIPLAKHCILLDMLLHAADSGHYKICRHVSKYIIIYLSEGLQQSKLILYPALMKDSESNVCHQSCT